MICMKCKGCRFDVNGSCVKGSKYSKKYCADFRNAFSREWIALQVKFGVRKIERPVDIESPKTLIWRSYQRGGFWDESFR